MARDIFHTLVKEALEREGWVVTHDPFPANLKIITAWKK